MSEVNMKELTILFDHIIRLMPIADPHQVGDNNIPCRASYVIFEGNLLPYTLVLLF